MTGLYAGLDSALVGISVTNFVYYYWYEWTRAALEKAALQAGRVTKQLTTVESMMAGAIAGSATVLLTNPIWVVNTRMTTRKNKESDIAGTTKAPSTVATLLALLREEGPTALFAGVVPALVLVLNPILQYTIFEQLKNTLEKRRRITPTVAFVLGALGKLFATSITYPYITVKSQAHVAGRDGTKESMLQAMRRIVGDEGYTGLYKGMQAFLFHSISIHPRRTCPFWKTSLYLIPEYYFPFPSDIFNDSPLPPPKPLPSPSNNQKATKRLTFSTGVVPKLTQSVLTAAFLFAFKDVLYAETVQVRRTLAARALAANK